MQSRGLADARTDVALPERRAAEQVTVLWRITVPACILSYPLHQQHLPNLTMFLLGIVSVIIAGLLASICVKNFTAEPRGDCSR